MLGTRCPNITGSVTQFRALGGTTDNSQGALTLNIVTGIANMVTGDPNLPLVNTVISLNASNSNLTYIANGNVRTNSLYLNTVIHR